MDRRPAWLVVVLLLLLAPLASGCASSRSGPVATDGAPPDFRLSLESRGARNPHCDYDLVFHADGRLDYDIRHLGVRPARRRGVVQLDAERLGVVWREVQASGAFDLPPLIGPHAERTDRGRVVVSVRGAGREHALVADRAGDESFDRLLRAVFWAVPHRLWQPPAPADR